MDSFFSSKVSSFFPGKTEDAQPETKNKNENEKPHSQPSNSELLTSAQLVASAAQSTFGGESDKVDKGKVAGAGADLLGAASNYGNLEEKSFGKYVDKAEDYLHNYHTTHSITTTTTTTTTNTTTTADAGKLDTETSATATTETPAKTGGGGGDGDSESGGYGDYLKMAGGFLKK